MEQRGGSPGDGGGIMCEVELRKIGHGGNAEVYQRCTLGNGKDTSDSAARQVVKRATGGMVSELQLRNEWMILMSLNEAGYEYSPKGFAYSGKELVMEYIDGITLDCVKMDEFSEAAFKKLIIDICEAVQALHELRPAFIHKDLKPSNIMIDKTGKVYLIDFGTAKLVKGYEQKEDCPGLSGDGISGAGTKRFAAPEQYGGLLGAFFGTDIFQLGKTIASLSAGANVSGRFMKELQEVIDKCCISNPAERYLRVSDVKSDILRIKVAGKVHSYFEWIRGHNRKSLFFNRIKRSFAQSSMKSNKPAVFIDIVRTSDTIEFS